VVSTDVRGDKALAVVEESSTTTHRETGGKLASKHRDLWMLAKGGGGWKITGFIKRFEWME
jgi:ketosteroid isomerase-like protein